MTQDGPHFASGGPKSDPSVAHPPSLHPAIQPRLDPSFVAGVVVVPSPPFGWSWTSTAAVRSVAHEENLAWRAALRPRSECCRSDAVTMEARGIRAMISSAEMGEDACTPPFPRSSGIGGRIVILGVVIELDLAYCFQILHSEEDSVGLDGDDDDDVDSL